MFIVLEGIDGSGKTSVSAGLQRRLTAEGLRVALTSEPTALIRPLLGRSGSIRDPAALFLLFTADRVHHQAELMDLLNAHDVVISDRYMLSSYAYQGTLISENTGSWEKAVEWMDAVSQFVALKPDMTVFLDVEPAMSVRRIREKRGDIHPYFEEENYLIRVRDSYIRLLDSSSVTIDSSDSLESVIDNAYSAVKERLEPR